MTRKLVIGCILCISALILSSGCVGPSLELQKGTIVSCSDFAKITDVYKTPHGVYFTVAELNRPVSIGYSDPAQFRIGRYATRNMWNNLVVYDLTPLNESSGLRDACEVS